MKVNCVCVSRRFVGITKEGAIKEVERKRKEGVSATLPTEWSVRCIRKKR